MSAPQRWITLRARICKDAHHMTVALDMALTGEQLSDHDPVTQNLKQWEDK